VGKAPLLGFKYMQPPFNVHMYGQVGSGSTDRLPTAATCMCQLKLPPYQDPRVLEEKLLYAISSDSGFELS
jgi:ubiquitin-protein ligase E3 B